MVIDLSFVGATNTRMSETIHRALQAAEVIVFCPSNPYLSLDPILSIPGIRQSLRAAAAPKIAVSPIISGSAVKGPAAKIMRELGLISSPITVFDRYDDLLTGFVLDRADGVLSDAIEVPTLVTDTMMSDLASKSQLAEQVLTFAQRLIEQPERQREK